MIESTQEGRRGKAAHETVGVLCGSVKERWCKKHICIVPPRLWLFVIVEIQIHSCNNYINQRLLLTDIEIGASNFSTFWYAFARD